MGLEGGRLATYIEQAIEKSPISRRGKHYKSIPASRSSVCSCYVNRSRCCTGELHSRRPFGLAKRLSFLRPDGNACSDERGVAMEHSLLIPTEIPVGCNCGWWLSIWRVSLVSETLGQHSQSHGGGGRHKERARKDTLPGDYNPEYTVKLPAITRRVLLLFFADPCRERQRKDSSA